MKILVCIKQVPDMESRFKLNSEGTWYDETDLAFRMNEYDEYAVEQAVQLKEQLGGEPEITILSIGPDRVVESIKKALAMGGDRGVHIQDNKYYQKDPWQIAAAIASHAGSQNYDIIFTGMQSQDRGSAQVGVTVAEQLGFACATTLVGFAYDSGTITAKRELEGGSKGVAKLKLPAVVTCQLGLNTPRYPTLPNIMKAKKKEILALPIADLLKEAELTATDKMYPPAKKGGGIIIEGEVGAQLERLMGILKEKTTVLR
ncbi:MAG: electron transfer flavoprotein subunit beta [Geobacteraceae bacterium GWC2_58_44]|nr:MAG: electron transfer flavoprotein subunit beta [Geobacteraceae bacterium GWC2_58_44]HBG07793.1 electron transfer flavoprotein subunit beta [Geobacter sp.]